MLFRSLLAVSFIAVSTLVGCASVPGPRPGTPEFTADIKRLDDFNLSDAYGRARYRRHPDAPAALAEIERELRTRQFPLAREWEHILRGEVVPGMTAAGVTAIYPIGRSKTIGYSVVDGEVCEDVRYWVGGSEFRYGDRYSVVTMRAGTVHDVLRDDGTYLSARGQNARAGR